MPRFQYQIVSLGIFNVADKMVNAFAHLGENGWELVGIYDKSSNWLAGYEKGFALFKRQVGEVGEIDGPWAQLVHADQVGKPHDPTGGAW